MPGNSDATRGAQPEKIGHYRVVSELGRGGMGTVYRAYEPSLNRDVAIKMLAAHLAEDESLVARFIREAKSIAAISHPNITHVYFTGTENGRPYFVMEYIAGRSLAGMIHDERRLDPRRSVELLLQAAMGLGAAHDRGIVHRDIKPSNLMIADDGTLKVTDFGIALAADFDDKLTRTGQFVGTSGYVSPEACKGGTVDARSDIFSLGIVLYEMLAGETPFHDDSPLGMLVQVVEQEVPDVRRCNPEVDEGLLRILERMVEKHPDKRFQTCHELAGALRGWLGQTDAGDSALAPTVAMPQTPPEQPQYRKRRWPAVALALVLFSAAAAGGWYYLGEGPWTRQAADAPSLAESEASSVPADSGAAGTVAPAADADGSDPDPVPDDPVGKGGGPDSAGIVAGSEDSGAAPADADPNGGADGAPVVTQAADDRTPGAGADEETTVTMVDEADAAATGPDRASDPAAAVPSRPEPAEPSTPRAVVVASGDPALAGPVRDTLARALQTTDYELMDAELLAGVNAYLDDDQVDVGGLGELVREQGGRVLVVATITYVGDTTLEYYGRTDTLHTSRIELRGYDLDRASSIGGGWSDEIRYTELNATEKAEQATAPMAAAIARTIRQSEP